MRIEQTMAIYIRIDVRRVFLWALLVGLFDFGGVCSTGPDSVYGIQLVHLSVQIRVPY